MKAAVGTTGMPKTEAALPWSELRRELGGFLKENEPLASRTAWGCGGPAALFLEPADLAELGRAQRRLCALGIDYLVIGGGRNLLVADAGIRKKAVFSLLAGFQGLELVGGDERAGLVRVESGVALARLVRFCGERGLAGCERLAGIPGSVGGAVAMNAGAYGQEIGDHLAALEVMVAGRCDWRPRTALRLGYRTGGLDPAEIVVAAWFLWPRGEPEALLAAAAEVRAERVRKLPAGRHAGSVFKNPPGDYAGRLLAEAGCRGLRRGRAQVAAEHANVIIVDPGVRAAEILALMEEMRRRVRERFGVELETEIKFLL